MITASAPGKLLLMGEHAVVYGYPCLVTAIDSRLSVSIQAIHGTDVNIDAPGVADTRFVSQAILVARKHWTNVPSGLRIQTKSQFSSHFGFGSSAAVSVATLFALGTFLGKKVTPQELFDLAYETTHAVQDGGSGFDVAAAVWGGTLLYEKQDGTAVDAVALDDVPLVVGYTGMKADTMSIVRDVAAKRQREEHKVDRIFQAIAELVGEAHTRMLEGDWQRVGKLFDFNQEYLRDLGVSSEKLETLIGAAKAAGAWGAKLSGAGGGDCMIAVVPPDRKAAVEAAIAKAAGEVMNVTPNAEGARIDA